MHGATSTIPVPPQAASNETALPFAHLNLRRNPFGEVAPPDRIELAVADLGDWPNRLSRPREAVQFLGDRGRGKTTHLMALRARFPQAPYLHLPEDGPLSSIPGGNDLLLIDELQRLPRRLLKDLLATGRPLAIGSHRDHRRALRRAGYHGETFRPADRFDAAVLERIAAKRIEAARRNPGPLPRLSAQTARGLVERFGSNVRAIEHELYERFQALQTVGEL